MPLTATLETKKRATVGMGQTCVGGADEELMAIVGSCIAVTLFCTRRKWAVMTHVVLPKSSNKNELPGKYADTAIPHMLQLAAQAGVPQTSLVAKIAGAASMFAKSTGPLQIGESNITAVEKALASVPIRIAAKHLGGDKGRRITFDCNTGTMAVEVVGSERLVL